MKERTTIRIKAAFLFAVFSLNSVLGFACSLGVDMGYNSTHHQKDEVLQEVVHVHEDGKKHIHENKEKHSRNTSHQQIIKVHLQPAPEKDNCCNDQVKELSQLDKSLPVALKIEHPFFALSFFAVFSNINIPARTDITKDIKQFVRSYHPPIPNIRIAIQSFQV